MVTCGEVLTYSQSWSYEKLRLWVDLLLRVAIVELVPSVTIYAEIVIVLNAKVKKGKIGYKPERANSCL
jgi:hypothetical protein